jgi:hypothetical protein
MQGNTNGSKFLEAQHDGFIFNDVVGAFICLTGELESLHSIILFWKVRLELSWLQS